MADFKDLKLGEKYQLGNKIGSGSFGEVFLGLNTITNEEIAIKLEKIDTKHPQLDYESKVYRLLKGGIGIPNLFWSGIEGSYNVLVTELLGPNLEDLFELCGKQFTLKTVLIIAEQMISRTEYVHSKNFIHRDIKPENFLTGLGKSLDRIYLIDFGLAKKYRDPDTGQHIECKENKSLVGTARYSSLNAHLGIEPSRRDDLESICYILIYFLKGFLPWQGAKSSGTLSKIDAIKEIKLATKIEELCKDLPDEFAKFLTYCRGLRFEDRPDYLFLKKMFKDLYAKTYGQSQCILDWRKPDLVLLFCKMLTIKEN